MLVPTNLIPPGLLPSKLNIVIILLLLLPLGGLIVRFTAGAGADDENDK